MKIGHQNQMILLTGLPRSGTTWAANVIAKTINYRLVHEPFNWRAHPERMIFHMKYLPANVENQELIQIIKRSIREPFPLFDQMTQKKGVLIKDVHICLAIESIWEQLHPKIIIMLRHPCAIALSWMALGYEIRFRIDNLLEQSTLVRDLLAPYVEHMKHEYDPYFMIGAYWGASYYILNQLFQLHPDWQWVIHEELCSDPVDHFSRLITNLDTHLSNAGLRMLTSLHNKYDHEQHTKFSPYSIIRVSEAEPQKWIKTLTAQQVQSVLEGEKPFGILEKYFGNPV